MFTANINSPANESRVDKDSDGKPVEQRKMSKKKKSEPTNLEADPLKKEEPPLVKSSETQDQVYTFSMRIFDHLDSCYLRNNQNLLEKSPSRV